MNVAASCGTMAFLAASVPTTLLGSPSSKVRNMDNALCQETFHGTGCWTLPIRPVSRQHDSCRHHSSPMGLEDLTAPKNKRFRICGAPMLQAGNTAAPQAYPHSSSALNRSSSHPCLIASATCSPKRTGGRHSRTRLSQTGARCLSSPDPRCWPATENGWHGGDPVQHGNSPYPASRKARGHPPTPAKKWHWSYPERSEG